jgi:hypothetical protein
MPAERKASNSTGPQKSGRHQMIDSTSKHFELRFLSLFDSRRGYAFPCDPAGQVDLDQLSDRARDNYLYARAVVGRELAMPAVRPSGFWPVIQDITMQQTSRVRNGSR